MTDIDTLWDFDHPDLSERRFREALATAATNAERAEVLTQLARAIGLQRRFNEAQATLDQLEPTQPMEPRLRARYLMERGRVFNSSGQPAAARPWFAQAYETALAAGEDNLAVDAAHMLAIVESGEQALVWNETALKLAEVSSDPKARRWLGSLYNNIGWTYHDMGRPADALSVFERALQWRVDNKRDQRDDSAIRIAKWSVARALRSLGRVDEALTLQRNLLGEHERLHEPDGYVFEELAECLLALSQADEARPYFALAHEHLSQDAWLAEHEPQRLSRLKALGAA